MSSVRLDATKAAGDPTQGPDLSRPTVSNRQKRHPSPAATFFGRRFASGVVTLLVATLLIFAAVQVLPGDVASNVLGRTATPARLAEVRKLLGLDDGLVTRYLHFLGGMLRGHFGNSTAALVQGRNVSVGSVISTPLWNSVVLAGITSIIFVPVCLLLGSLAALKAGKVTDRAISSGALAIGALPEFVVGTLLIVVFFTQLNWLPPISTIPAGGSPFGHITSLILPVLTLLGVSLAFGTRLLRASMLETLDYDYVAMARLRGFRERRVILRYVLRNALAPSVQILAQMVQWLIGGIIVTEAVFNYPGIGTALVQAVTVRDVQVVMVIATLLAAIYIAINVVADFCVVLLVPKLRTRG